MTGDRTKPTYEDLERKVRQLEATNIELPAIVDAIEFRNSPGWKPVVEVVGCSPRNIAP